MDKPENYGPLIQSLQLTYPDLEYSFVTVIIGALGTVPKNFHGNIRHLNFNNKESNIIKVIQQRAIIGTVKICRKFILKCILKNE